MASRSKLGAPPPAVAVKAEVCDRIEKETTPKAEVDRVYAADQAEDDEIHYLSKNAQFFDVVLAKSHINPAYALNLPVAASSMFPSTVGHVILRHGGKDWKVRCPRDTHRGRRFDSGWKNFVLANCLEPDDACVFELIEPDPLEPTFKVHVIRHALPPELEALINARGKTADSPIVLD